MEILYVSSLCSIRKFDDLSSSGTFKPEFAVQKFHQLLAQGFVLNSCKIETLSPCPVNKDSHKRLFWKKEIETIDGIMYQYLPFINYPFLRQITLFISGIISTVSWISKNRKSEKIIVCDILNVTVAASAMLVGRLFKIQVVGVVTDIPSIMISSNNVRKSLLEKMTPFIDEKLNNLYSSYVLLTQYMCSYINRYNRPSCVIEGVVDVNRTHVQRIEKNSVRTLIYAGSLFEANGVRQLIEAFRQIKGDHLRLSIYGSGEIEKEMDLFMKMDSRLIYHGSVPNMEVVEAELNATLLINPRFSNAEFTKYSFPSKNLEYMASGVPLLSTCLPGMPKEYYDYIYTFKDESLDGFIRTLSFILSLPDKDLKLKGQSAKEFVLREKNNVYQTQKILEMVKLTS